MKNKKGFTLVELLAVIVILALIMGIAVVSMSGVISSSRSKTYQESAAGVISGLRQRLIIDNLGAGNSNGKKYYVTSKILESGGKTSPYGSEFLWATGGTGGECSNADDQYCEATNPPTSCTATTKAYVEIDSNGVYKACLADGTHYVYDDEAKLIEAKATIQQ